MTDCDSARSNRYVKYVSFSASIAEIISGRFPSQRLKTDMPNDNDFSDNVLILYNNDDARQEQKLFANYCGKTLSHSTSPMSVTFDLPGNAEMHRGKSFTHIYAHSQVDKLPKIFSGTSVTHYSIALESWYSHAIDRIKNVPQNDIDQFIETVLEQFKAIVPSDYEGIAAYYLAIHSRQLKLHEQNFAAFLKKQYRFPDDARTNEISVVDYFKSLSPNELKAAHANALSFEHSKIVGNSQPMKDVMDMIARVAPEDDMKVLIRGETGTGKELIAQAIHLASPRQSKPFICLNCAAIAESLQESELFGHEKGAFTDATESRKGKFEAAHGGTLFLDEIGDMTPTLQSKFLRVLEGHPFARVGGNTSITVDVRVISATHKNLDADVAQGCFREDLYHRINDIQIIVPPLRDRKGDIPILARFFLDQRCAKTKLIYQGFSQEAMNALLAHSWSGNVRELEKVVRRAVVFGTPPLIQKADLHIISPATTHVSSYPTVTGATPNSSPLRIGISSEDQQLINDLSTSNPHVGNVQIKEWIEALRKYENAYTSTGGDWDKAAVELGVTRRTLVNHRNNIGEKIRASELASDSLTQLSTKFPNTTKKSGRVKIWS
jgi:transcriptional regulator with GAF, ATPase, and Fis domain